MNQDARKTNIKIAYTLSFLSELYFPISAWIFYYLRFLDFKQIAIITTVQVIMGNLLEIPTGAFADIVGRKKAVFLSFFIFSLVMFSFAFTSVFWIFIILEIFKGLSNSLYSGSLESLTYDTLKEGNKESTFDKVVSNMETAAWIGLFISAIAGGFLYQYWFRSPWIIQGIIYALAALMVLKLHEPAIDTKKYSLKMIIAQNTSGFKEIFKNIKITQATIVFIIIGAGYFIASNILGISQAREYGMDSRGVGLLFSAGYLISALVSQIFPRLKNWLGAKNLLIATVCVLIGSFIFAKSAGVAIGSILIISRISSSTTFRNIRSSVLNRFIDSKNRATAISTLILLSQLPYVLVAYTIGDYIDKSSPNSFAFILGLAMIGLLVVQQIIFSITRLRTVKTNQG